MVLLQWCTLLDNICTLVGLHATTPLIASHTPPQLPLVYGCAANGTIVTITMAPLEAEGRGATLFWRPEALAEPCVQETLVTT